MPATQRRSRRQLVAAGPWKGVRDTVEPYDDATNFLVDATNVYIPDPDGSSGVFARAGFALLNGGAKLYTGRGQCVYTHIAVDGTAYPFIVGGGKLYRGNIGLTTFTDVTPVGVTISAAVTTRVKMVSLGDSLIVSDGVNRPWIADNLSATPITGKYINYDQGTGDGIAWSAQDITVFGGSFFVILKQVGGIARQSDISWSEPGQPDIGWQQLDFDNNWTLEQTGSSPLYAIVGTNVALYYFRQQAIGAISGAVGPDLQTTSTHDAVSYNVGTRSPQCIVAYGYHLYFVDTQGRPWRMRLGDPPEDIWLNMRAVVDQAPTTAPAFVQQVGCAAFEPTQDLYLVAPWSQNIAGSGPPPPAEMYQFAASSGQYVGRWNIKGPQGVGIEAMGILVDGLGMGRLIVLGSRAQAPAPGGWVWGLNPITSATATHITTEGTSPPPPILTTEGGARLVTENTPVNWTDDGFTPDVSVTTVRLGYEADVMWNIDRVTVVCGSPDPIRVSIRTSANPVQLVGTPSAGTSADLTYRLVVGVAMAGRGAEITVAPLNATAQWSIDKIAMVAVASQTRPEDA